MKKRTDENKRLNALLVAFAAGTLLLSGCGSGEDEVPAEESPVAPAPSDAPAPPVEPPPPPPPPPAAAPCVAINSAQIGFTAVDIYYDWANIVGGSLPANGSTPAITYGTVAVATTAAGGSYSRTGSDGTLSMNITQSTTAATSPFSGYSGYPTGYPYSSNSYTTPTSGLSAVKAAATGYLSINSLVQQDILYKAQMGQISGVTATTVDQICVSGIAINMGHYYYYLYGGIVYLYLNNTTHGYKMYF
ncbi:MAG: hypothetical protein AAB425_03460 [Bdellovibrionota bacterium]